jgi:hypothetical protein
MSIQEHILEAALRICRERGSWTFGPGEIVAALADLNPGSVRTHVMSRCCVNAPAHHAHRWPYFHRVRRGVYEILPDWRRLRGPGRSKAATSSGRKHPAEPTGVVVEVRESSVGYVAEIPGRSGKIRGSSLDEMATQVRTAAGKTGTAPPGLLCPLQLQIDLEPDRPDPVVEAYEKDIDRTLVRRRLRMSFEERLLTLDKWMRDTEELRGAVRRAGRRAAK